MKRVIPLLALVPLASCNQAESAQQTPTTKAPYFATAVGRVDSAEEARQLVAIVDGVIKEVLVKRGDSVNAGQPLLKVDCAPQVFAVGAREAQTHEAAVAAYRVSEGAREEDLRTARANLDAALASKSEADVQFKRVDRLKVAGFATLREVDARQSARDNAAAQLAAAEAQLDRLKNGPRPSEIAQANAATRTAAAEVRAAQSRANQCTLRSPVNGTVLQILRQEGEFSGASQGIPLIIVGNLSRLIVRAEISERDAALVHAGQRAVVWIDGQPEKWPGRVTELASVMGRRTARSLDPTDRFDRDVREALISFVDTPPPALVGLRVTVGIAK